MLKAIKIRLYPNPTQENTLNSLLGSYRFVYNQCLAFKKDKYENHQENANLSDLGHHFHQTLRSEYEWLKEHNTKVLKQSILNLDQAYKNFFKAKKGFPKFKSKFDEQRARFPYEAVAAKTFDEDASLLNLTKTINKLKFECSDRDKNYLYKNKAGIKSVTIIKTKTGKFFASIFVEGGLLREMSTPTNEAVGIDLGIKTLLTLSDGTSYANPKWIRKSEKKLKKLHKRLSKKVKGSNNRTKAKLKLARAHEKIKNQKTDYLHNITTKIINENQVIILEDLNVSGMMKNHKLAKSIQELGLYEMRRQLEYKSLWYGRELVFVDRFFPSSKTCSDCGWINHNLTLADRKFECQGCGLVIDRDDNASINIENEGRRIYNIMMDAKRHQKIEQRLLESQKPEMVSAKSVEHPTMDDRYASNLKSSGALSQKNVIC